MITQRYKDYLKSKKWKDKRQQAFAYYGRRCFACAKSPRVLHIHHLSYDHLYNEPMADLMPLCPPCHKEVTKLSRRYRKRGTRRVTLEFVKAKRASLKK